MDSLLHVLDSTYQVPFESAVQAEGKMNEWCSLRSMDKQLSPEERARYARHLILPEMGEEGQKKLKKSSVIVVGAGGLGSPTLLYLAAAGVGKIGIIDDDKVDITNLQRQVIHSTAAVGSLKVESAANRIREAGAGGSRPQRGSAGAAARQEGRGPRPGGEVPRRPAADK